tara:strand:- start:19454 stop:20095 length:642 start_codon:yes stop_codon:yes gene_type:complete
MSKFLSSTEEEQKAIILSIWEKYRILILAIIVLIPLTIIIREYLESSQQETQFESAKLYEEFLKAEGEQKLVIGKNFVSFYPGSLKSQLVQLNLAKISYESGDIQEAIAYLEDLNNENKKNSEGNFDPIESATKLRLSKIYLEKNEPNKVIQLLEDSNLHNSSLFEIKGDAFVKLGLISQARVNYLQAIEKSQTQTSLAIINMKIADLGEADD